MAKLDPRALRPVELARLLNSTPLGEVISTRTIYRHRNRAGYRVGDGSTMDLVRYAAWLARKRHEGGDEEGPQSYEERKDTIARQERARSRKGRDIAPLPDVENPERRERAAADFQYFCEAYFPNVFYLPWSEDHRTVLGKAEQAILEGGLFALAMPRGSGKTSICERACIWAILYGHRRFVTLIGSDEGHATTMLDTIKAALETNERLAADFPEVCYPIERLGGITQRAKGQLFEGERTHISWTSKEIVLPTIPGSLASGTILKVAGITGRIRGMKHQTAEGEPVRPDLVILDDPQTDESARSDSQCAARESVLSGAVLGLPDPGKKISGIMPCTVIRPGDMADRILDRNQNPEWQGERMKMVYSFPDSEKLWQQYAEILHSNPDNYRKCREEATEFYRNRRAEMDRGAEVAWPERHEPDELSGLQCAMNLKLRDEATFWAEYQNNPQMPGSDDSVVLDAEEIAAKTNGRKQGKVPVHCDTLTCHIDVHKKVLFYAVTAWEPGFTGYVVDYGTYPEQRQSYFRMDGVDRTVRRIHQGMGVDGAIYKGLEELTDELLSREWPRGDGAVMRIRLCLIDQGWKTDLIHQFCRQSQWAGTLMPARGQGITASQKPISEYSRKRGDRIGHHWWIPSIKRKRALRHVEVDTNYWKTFIHERLGTAMGDSGCLSLFGRRPTTHRLFADHLSAEYRVVTEGRGRTVDEWKLPAHKPDNHWLDCMVGCAAAASMRGIQRVGAPSVKPRKKKKKRKRRRVKPLKC